MKPNRIIIALGAALVLAAAAQAEDIRIIVPYVGTLTNSVEPEGMGTIDDSGLLTGLYFQWVRPEAYQWNAFLYYAPDVNYSTVIGGHFIYDHYIGPDWNGRFLVGAGMEALRVEMDAGDDLGIPAFAMDTTVLIPYLRAGKYFRTRVGPASLSALPWAGIQPQWIRGDLDMTVTIPFPPPGHNMAISTSLDDEDLFGIAGLNLKATLFHFIDLEGKYQATFNGDDWFNTYNATVNVFLSRSWGLSYRFKDMESTEGGNTYHYFGAAYVF